MKQELFNVEYQIKEAKLLKGNKDFLGELKQKKKSLIHQIATQLNKEGLEKKGKGR